MRSSRSLGSSSRISCARASILFRISSSIVLLKQCANRHKLGEDVPELAADLEQPCDRDGDVFVAPRAHVPIVASPGRPRKMTDRDVPLLVVVTGPPASGKTTIAEALARKLSLPLVTKDAIKELLFESLGTGDRDWSRALGRATFAVMFLWLEAELRAGHSVIAEANFDAATAGGEVDRLPPHRTVQVYCTAPRALVLARYAARTRHPGHLGHSVLPEVEAGLDAARWAPLPLEGDLVELNTAQPVELNALLADIRRQLG